ncbi:MAG: Na/Pi cotransporter family protein, partial [Gammaproteobacteria bacterium]|nr:Na/Pi cotransporter family protein [Gammaproteobacteria bacterium]
IGVIMGANVGTTVTAQIVAFKVEEAALLIIAVGFAMLFLSNNDRVKQYGNIIMGLGMVFFGMSTMSEAMEPLRTYQPFIDLMAKMENPLLGILAAAVFTAMVQSSSATTGIVIAMASQGLITLAAGIALIFGSNIGTCVTALLAAFGKSTEAVRVACVHVLFNVAGVLLWVMFIPQLAGIVAAVSPASPELTGATRLAAEVPRQVANAHTIFNVSNTLLFLLVTTQFARLVERLVPRRAKKGKVIIEPKYLDSALIETPALALDRVRMELGHLGSVTQSLLVQIRQAFLDGTHAGLDKVARLDDRTDILHAAIIEYLNEIMKNELTTEENDLVLRYIRVSEDLERVGDVIETELVATGHRAIDAGIKPSDTTQHVLGALYDQVRKALDDAVQSVGENDQIAAEGVVNQKSDINFLIDDALKFQAERLASRTEQAMTTTRVENEIIDGLKRIYSLSKRIAKLVLPKAMLEEGG